MLSHRAWIALLGTIVMAATLGLTACPPYTSVRIGQKTVYPYLLYAAGYNTNKLYVYGVQSNGIINQPALNGYAANNLKAPVGIAVTSTASGYQYIVVSDSVDDSLDVYTYNVNGSLDYVGYIVDTDGPYGLVYDVDYDDLFEVRTNTDSLALFSVLNDPPYLQFQSSVTIPSQAAVPAIMPLTHNVYIGGSGTMDLYYYGRGANKTLTLLGKTSLGSQVFYVGAIGNSGYLMDVDNGGSGSSSQIEVWSDGATGPTLSQKISMPGASSASCTSGALGSIYCYVGGPSFIAEYQFENSLLTALSPPSISIPTNSHYLGVGPSDTFLYNGDTSANLTSYGIGTTGQITPQGTYVRNATSWLSIRNSL
jgi:hypothetical protein